MEYRIVEAEDIKIVGVKAEANFNTINSITPQLAKQFMPRLKEITSRKDDFSLSLQKYTDFNFKMFNPNDVFEKWIGVEVRDFDAIPQNMETLLIPASKYLVIDFKGTIPKFIKLWQHIHSTWLPNSEFELDNRPHFERLPSSYSPIQAINEEEIWIPIK